MIDKKAIGNRIKEYREKSGLTQEKLAEKVHLSTSYLSAVERGVSFPRIDNLIAIMTAVGATADQIFIDVIANSYQLKTSVLSEEIEKLPVKEQNRIFAVVKTLIEQA